MPVFFIIDNLIFHARFCILRSGTMIFTQRETSSEFEPGFFFWSG